MQIQLLPSQEFFECDAHETLLEAALRSGLSLNYGCNDGRCGECKARVLQGEFTQSRFHDFAFSPAERAQGAILLCSTTPVTDGVIEVAVQQIQDIPWQQLECKISRLERLRPDIIEMHLRTPRSQALRFMAGQSVRIHLAEGVPAAVLPIASCPCNGQVLHFHIQAEAGQPFADFIFHQLKNRQTVHIEGPIGLFTLDDDSTRPVIFIAYEIGFSYIKSLIEHAIALDWQQPMTFYWWCCEPGGHYLDNYCRAWEDALDHFRVHLLHGEKQSPLACLEQGNALLDQQHPNWQDYDIYLAVPPHWATLFEPALIQRGFPTERLFIAPPIVLG